ncbi:methyltransferase [Cytobacillus eiseniae]|uniref:Methyltransferase n=1 Tax=Cytobacillus eiseniae TaxID=762947 RepID=A0ABS4REH6_9BACI|nr:isoprenylcysteine carboxyl methyltransferase family protein [Cytobacillus eiseniae]MBP2241300.1 methyltransferase [Cytobacillus eiseniae]
MLFLLFISLLICQRLAELVIAKRNEQQMKQLGAVEFGQSHYPFIVAVHSLFFLAFMIEVIVLKKAISPTWPVLLPIFLALQVGRVWALSSLGKYWNTKIIVMPNAEIVKRGPYRYIKHPNYLIVTLELIIIPLLFQAYFTAIVFTILNAVILAIRISAEEKALKHLTDYKDQFVENPSLVKKFNKV